MFVAFSMNSTILIIKYPELLFFCPHNLYWKTTLEPHHFYGQNLSSFQPKFIHGQITLICSCANIVC